MIVASILNRLAFENMKLDIRLIKRISYRDDEEEGEQRER